jgi:hypothetical protein
MDEVMKRLGVNLVEKHGTTVIPIVECNVAGKHVGGGKSKWLSQLRGYTIKLNLVIDDIKKQPIEKLECIKEALEAG